MKKLILFELRKVFSKRLALIALIGIILFSALLSFSTFQNKYAFDQNIGEGTGKTAVEIDKEIAAKYKGILTDEKVQQLMSDFAPTSDLHGLSAIYVYQNAMQSAAFSRFSDEEGKWNGLSVSDVFGNEEIKIGYVDGWLSTSRNMVRVFVALALAVIIMLAPIFSGEYEGVDNIILTSKCCMRYGQSRQHYSFWELGQVSLAVYLPSTKFHKYGMTCRTTAKEKSRRTADISARPF